MCCSGSNRHLGKPTECGFVRSCSASKREKAWLNIGQEEHVWEITTWGKASVAFCFVFRDYSFLSFSLFTLPHPGWF